MRATKQPWYRIDVFRRCKTGEVIEATPWTLARKLRFVAMGLLIGVPVVFAKLWFFNTWVPRYYAELDALAKIDSAASARKLAEFVSLLLLAPTLTAIAVVIPAVVMAYRVMRVGRWPLPGAKVRRRTEVIAGWCVRLPALLLGLLLPACMFIAWSSYVWLVVFFWDGYLDKIATPMHAAHGRTVAGIRSSVNFDIMMQSHHDAVDAQSSPRRLPMRTTIDIPEREHALFTSLARAQHTSLSKLLLDLARRGLETPDRVAEAAPSYRIDPETGLAVFRSGRPVTIDDVRALEEEDDLRAYGGS